MAAVEKARQEDAYAALNEAERTAIDRAINELLVVYHSDDHTLIRDKIDGVDQATQSLAEAIINSVAERALKGTKIDD
jgi:uncharacterized protein YaaW (UPF0174 family)